MRMSTPMRTMKCPILNEYRCEFLVELSTLGNSTQ
jgi:hypothetical protein